MMWLRMLLLSVALTETAGGQALPRCLPAETGMSAQRLEVVDSVVAAAIKAGDAPGAVVLVGCRGCIVYRKAFGNKALTPTMEPMTEDTIFDVASLTKPVATATSIMLLVEDGKLSLSDTVAAFLPDFASHEKGAVTLLQLLTHYSGLRPDLDLDEPWSGYETAVSKACAEKLVALPGERFIYSDINYLVLGEVVRLVGGRQISDFVRERVFVPLNMVDTGFLPSPEMMSRIAPSERRNDRIIRGEVHDPTAFRMGGVAGHAGLFSTADDLAIYAQALLNGGIHSAVRILSPLSVVKMSTPQSPPEAAAWRGVGFDIRSPFSHNRGDLLPVGSFGHTGFTGTSLWIDPFTETFVVILTNRLHPDGKGNATPLRRRVASVVAASLVEIPSWRELYERSR